MATKKRIHNDPMNLYDLIVNCELTGRKVRNKVI